MAKIALTTRQNILRRDKFRCQMCGRSAQDGIALEVDHRLPVSKGGTNAMSNLWTLCDACNRGKSDGHIDKVDPRAIDSKLHRSKDILQRVHDEMGVKEVLIGFSGGKDSMVVMDLAIEIFDKVEGFFLYWVKGLDCEQTYLNFARRKWGVTIHELPSHHMINAVRSNMYMPGYTQTKKIPKCHQVDTEALVRRQSGIKMILYGMRMQDSLQRRAMIKSLGIVDAKGGRTYPIFDWVNNEVYAYIRARGLPIPPLYGGKLSGNVNLGSETLLYLKEHHPDDFEKVKEIFPFITAHLARDEFQRIDS